MKNLIFTLCLMASSFIASAQLTIQRAYTPQNGRQYFEIRNNTGTQQPLGCYSLLTHYQDIDEAGFYIITLPTGNIGPGEIIKIGAEDQLNPLNPPGRLQLSWKQLSEWNNIRKYRMSDNQMELMEIQLDNSFSEVKNFFRNDRQQVHHVVLLLKESTVLDASVSVDAENELPDFLNHLPRLHFENSCGSRVNIDLHSLKQRFPYIFNRPDQQNTTGHFREFHVQQNTAGVQVAWQMAREMQNRGYFIERRNEGSPWTTVAYVASMANEGMHNQSLHYMYGENTLVNDRTEYRLRSVDVEGRTFYSPVKMINAQGHRAQLVVYPNPSRDGRANISFGNTNTLKDIQVVDISGQLIRQWIAVNSTAQQIQNLRTGHYIVRVVDRQTGAVYTEKLIVSN